jgi:outer membrane immunogenic protein
MMAFVGHHWGHDMKTVTQVSIAAVAVLAATAANAADIPRKAPPKVTPPPPAFSWTGCYVGGQVGGGWGRKEIEHDEIGPDPGISSSSAHISGGVVGGQIGCDYQFAGAWVIGIAGDAVWANIKGTGPEPEESDEGGPGSETFSVTNNFLGSITGRLGYSFWNTGLIYIKGGAAWAHDTYDFSNASELAFLTFQSTGLNESRTGWTLGGGVEWAFAANWSARVEYAHYDFGNKSYSFTFPPFSGFGPAPETFVASINQRIDTVTFGVNYRFGVPFLARY